MQSFLLEMKSSTDLIHSFKVMHLQFPLRALMSSVIASMSLFLHLVAIPHETYTDARS